MEITGTKLRAVAPTLGSLGETSNGIVVLLVNLVVLVGVSLITRPSKAAREQRA